MIKEDEIENYLIKPFNTISVEDGDEKKFKKKQKCATLIGLWNFLYIFARLLYVKININTLLANTTVTDMHVYYFENEKQIVP